MRRFVIIGGADIKDYALIRSYFTQNDFYVYCDCGLKHIDGLGVIPDLIIGDFDSHAQPEGMHNVIVLPVMKDDTDTIYAVKEGIRRGYEDFLMIGATGGRQDHNLGNIYALLMLAKCGKNAMIVDDYGEMSIISAGETRHVKYGYKFFSLLNISGTARGITITNAKYCLEDAEIFPEYQYGISNEVINDEAVITLREGCLLLVCVR